MTKMFRCDRCKFIGEDFYTVSVETVAVVSFGMYKKHLCNECRKSLKKFMGHKLLEVE